MRRRTQKQRYKEHQRSNFEENKKELKSSLSNFIGHGHLFDSYYVFFNKLRSDLSIINESEKSNYDRQIERINKGVDTHYKDHMFKYLDYNNEESTFKNLIDAYVKLLEELIINERLAEEKWLKRILEVLPKSAKAADGEKRFEKINRLLEKIERREWTSITQDDYMDMIEELNNLGNLNQYKKKVRKKEVRKKRKK